MGSIDESVNFRVCASDKLESSWCTDEVCDLIKDVRALNFFESRDSLSLPPAVSFTGRWCARTRGTWLSAVTST